MIAKAVKGKGFRGALEYDLTKEKGRVIDTNMAGEGPRELAAEFGQIRKLRPNLGKAVLHVSLSAALGEKLTDGQWRDIAETYLVGMGLENNQYLVTRHTDTEHEHVHILVNRIRLDGTVTSDSLDYKRQELLMRKIEIQYELERVAPSLESIRAAPTRGELEKAVRTGVESTRAQLQYKCDVVVQGCTTFTDYVARLETQGVEVMAITQLQGEKLSGLMYRLDGVLMKGSDLGRGYSPAGLDKRGVGYGQSRDDAAVRRCQEREAARGAVGADRERAPGQVPERGGAGRSVGAVGAGDDDAGVRHKGRVVGGRSPERGAGSGVHGADAARDRAMEDGFGGGEGERRSAGQGRRSVEVEALQNDGGGGPGFGSARERVVHLAGAQADHREHPGPEGSGRVSQARRDRSAEAVQRQIGAMAGLGVSVFEVEARAATGEVDRRAWSRAVLEQPESLAWLKFMNARGRDIVVRPAGPHGLVLIDQLPIDALVRMKQGGVTPAATLETSPGVYQAWVKLVDGAVRPDIRAGVELGLTAMYRGESGLGGTTYGQQFGRLAGFTNWQQVRDGRPPYVLAHDCPGQVAADAPRVLRAAEMAIDEQAIRRERQRRLEAVRAAPGEAMGRFGQADPVREYQRQARRLLERYGETVDLSRLDWMVAQDMAKSGRFTVTQIEQGLREGSPNVEGRKAGHVDDYAQRTAAKAWVSSEVRTYREEKAKEAQMQRRRGPTL